MIRAVEAPRRTLPRVDQGFSPAFLVASLVLTLTLGAGSGLFYLWRMGMGAEVPLSHRQIHGHTQALGFAALFVIGIAYHVLPRMLGASPASAREKSAVLWLMVSGVVLRNLAQPFAFWAIGGGLSLLSGLLEAAAGTLFTVGLAGAVFGARHAATRFEKNEPRWPGAKDPLALFLPIGALCLLAGLGLSVMQGAWLAAHRDATLPAALTEPFYHAALTGFTLAFVFGFAGRFMPVFLGIGLPREGTFPITAALLVLGIGAGCVSWIPSLGERALLVRDVGTVLVAVAASVYVLGCGLVFRRRKLPIPPAAGWAIPAIRMAFASLLLWALLGIATVALARATPFPARNPWWTDAGRHLFTIGFLTMLIVGMALRVLPIFGGKPLASPRMAKVTVALLALGTAMRLLEYPAALRPSLYALGSYMGIPVVIALVLFMLNLRRTAKGR
jgi:hypothetical protein